MNVGPILIFAPHPDDECLACAGVIARAAGVEPDQVCVVILTDGEAHLQACAYYHCRQAAQHNTDRMGLCIGAIRFLGRQAGQPRAWLAFYAADQRGEPLPDIHLSLDARSTQTNAQGYALMELPISALRPTLTVTVGDVRHDLPVERMLSQADRRRFGLQRRRESCQALALLGVPDRGLEFWSYPDQGLSAIRADQSQPDPPTRVTIQARIRERLATLRPAIIYLPHRCDADSDHRATHDLVMAVLETWREAPLVYSYVVHPSGSHNEWPPPAYCPPDRESRYRPNMAMLPPPGFAEPDLRLALDDSLSPSRKGDVLRLYRSQMAADDNGFLLAFAKRDEIFWRE